MKMQIVLAIFSLVVLLHVQQQTAKVAGDEHIKQLLLNLPPDSHMRMELERGDRGDGIHHQWMDEMRSLGVKRAKIVLTFQWRGRPTDIRLLRMIFFKSYDADCAQIIDPGQLETIKKSNFARELEDFAIRRTAKSRWTAIEHIPQADKGIARLEVMDDEWVPTYPPLLRPILDDQLSEVILEADVMQLQEVLRSGKASTEELDGALMEAADSLDDSCFIRPILTAGANPNIHNDDGDTPLIFAATAGLLHNVEVLLEAGADPAIKNGFGETALDIAQKRGHQKIVSMLEAGKRR